MFSPARKETDVAENNMSLNNPRSGHHVKRSVVERNLGTATTSGYKNACKSRGKTTLFEVHILNHLGDMLLNYRTHKFCESNEKSVKKVSLGKYELIVQLYNQRFRVQFVFVGTIF